MRLTVRLSGRLGLAIFSCVLFLSGCAGSSGGGSSSSTITGTTTSTPTVALTVTGVSPTDVPVNSPDLTLLVAGTGFASGSVVSLNGTAESTTYVSSTELHATVPAAQLKTGAVLSVAVSNGATTVKADAGTISLSVDNPVPALASVTPGSVLLGAAPATVQVTGSNFVPGVQLAVNGTVRNTTYVSDTQLTADLVATDFASAGSLPLNVINPKPGGGTSGTSALGVNNPAATIASLSPSSAVAGSAPVTVTVTGSGFLAGTALQVNGATRAVTVASGTQLSFALTAADLTGAGTLSVTASNPLPGGGSGAGKSFTVNNPAPVVASFSPTTYTAGSAAAALTVTGSGFISGTTAAVNGSARTVTYNNASQVAIALSANDLANAGTLSLVFTNAGPGGGVSAATSVPVNNPAPAIALLSPASIPVGSGTTTVTIAGTGFNGSTALQVNGAAHPFTLVSPTQLTADFAATELAGTATLSLTVVNAAPGGGTSPAASLVVGNPIPVITSLSPSSVPAGVATTVTINGTGFSSGTTLQVGGNAHAATYVSSTQMTVALTPTELTSVTSLGLVLTNGSPAGGSSQSSTLTVVARNSSIIGVTPTIFYINQGSGSLTVLGSGLTPAHKVLWNNTVLPTGYVSGGYYYNGLYYSTYLAATVSADLLASTGTASISISNAGTVPTSNSVTVTISNPPVPAITGLSPSVGPMGVDAAISVYGTGFTKSSTVSFNGTALTTTYTNSSTLAVTIPASMLSFPGNGSVTVNTPAPGGGTSVAAAFTTYAPVVSNNMVYNPVNGLLYLSIPSTGSAVTGNSVVSMDPSTGALGTPIYVGSEPGAMAVSDDGTTLWVALNGTSAIRKVDLVNAVAGAQFSTNAITSYPSSSYYMTALRAIPGSTTSVVAANAYAMGMYDAGVLRGSTVSVNSVYALQIDGTRSEIYTGGYSLKTYTYDSSGITLKSANSSGTTSFASSTYDEMQLANSKMFTDVGKVLDPESGALLGTLFSTGTVAATGPTLYDSTSGSVLVLDYSAGSTYPNVYDQVQLFNPTDYTATGKKIPWTIPTSLYINSQYMYFNPHRLTRWGTNGLAVHTNAGVFSIQSDVLKDQSSLSADLSVAMTASGGITTGTTATYSTTVTNAGPSAANDVVVAIQPPSTGIITSAASSVGACPSLNGCALGSLAKGATATVTISVLQTTAGTGALTVQVRGSTPDPVSNNNSATVSTVVTGSTYNLTPTAASVSPNSIKAGSTDTTITVTGTNFVSGASVMLGSSALSTTYVSGTQLRATVPTASLASMGWLAISVSNPSPGGGSSATLPVTIYSVITLGLNRLAYEPFTQKLYAGVSSGSSTITGSSVVALDPVTGVFGTPITLSAVPVNLAISDSGKVLYAGISLPQSGQNSSSGLTRIDLATRATDTFTSVSSFSGSPAFAVQPGSDNTVALVPTAYSYTYLYDFNPSTRAFSPRNSTSSYTSSYSSCVYFLNASTTLVNYFGSLSSYPVSSSGLGAGQTISGGTSSCFRLSGNYAFQPNGQVFLLTASTATKTGTFAVSNSYSNGLTDGGVAPDLSLRSAFLPTSSTSTYYVDGVTSYDTQTYVANSSLSLNFPINEGTSYNYTVNDILRWGQDGLALTTSTGHIYLLRGPFVVPGLLQSNTAASITAVSSSTIAIGSGNTLLTVTGSNFIPGVAVTWNGSYRTTTIVDATHVTVAIPASDLAAAATGSLVATNPGASASSALTVTVQ